MRPHHRFLVRAATGAATVTISTALLVPAPSAQALWVRPAQAPLTNAAGATNGCVASVDPMTVGWYGGPGPSVRLGATLACPASADVHRQSFAMSLEQKMPDGTVRVIISHGDLAKSGSSEPSLDGGAGATVPCSTLGGAGRHTLIVRWLVKTKTSTTDTAPYVAKVDRRHTAGCPR